MGELTAATAKLPASSFPASSAKKEPSAASSGLTSSPAALDPVDRLILSWLVHCGFERSFAHMPAAPIYVDPNTASLASRAKLMALVTNGNTAEAVAHFRANFPLLTMQTSASGDSFNGPEAFDSNSAADSAPSVALIDLPAALQSASAPPPFQCYFLLLLQQMIEMVRVGDLVAVLDFINAELVPLTASSLAAHNWLQDALGLLAYADPSTSPLSGLLDKARWPWLAELLNHAICARTLSPSGALETLLKQVLAVDGLIHETDILAPDEQAAKKWRDLQSCFAGTSIVPPSLADPKSCKTIKRD